VLANFVAGLDGSVALQGRVGALTSRTDQVVFRLLRELADVVLVGAGTIRARRYGRLVVGQAACRHRADRGRGPAPPPPSPPIVKKESQWLTPSRSAIVIQ